MENSSPNLTQIWKGVLGELEVELGKNNFGLYFRNSQLLSIADGVVKLGFLNKGVADQVSARYYILVQSALQRALKTERVSLIFEVVKRAEGTEKREESDSVGPLFEEPKIDREEIQIAIKRANLREDYTFEEFCVSTSNQLAFAAAQAVAREPGKNYNPLFIWGGVGIGKTHLMQAVGHEVVRKKPKARVIFAPGEQFTNEIITAIRTKDTAGFKERYRSAEALLIDDIQFFSGKDTAQEEFFHTFNAIYQRGGQIIMTSDRKPADISDLTDRLRSRFEGGMVVDISTPDSELKTAICVLKAKNRGIELSNSAAALISSDVDNIRSMEGSLQRIIIEAENKKSPINEELIKEVLKINNIEERRESRGERANNRIDARMVLDQVCIYYGLPIKLIKGEKRDKPIVIPRQVLMYLLKKNTGMTLQEIAAYIGGRDHTTIIHGVRKIENLILENERVRNEVLTIEEKLGISRG